MTSEKLLNDFRGVYAFEFMKKHKLTLTDYHGFIDCFRECRETGSAKTFVKSIAKVFKKYGFNVNLGPDGVNYAITEGGRK